MSIHEYKTFKSPFFAETCLSEFPRQVWAGLVHSTVDSFLKLIAAHPPRF